MSTPRRLAGLSPVHLLLLVAVAELSITRLAVPTLAPRAAESTHHATSAAAPLWYQALDNLGLFLLYFGTTLAIAVLALRAWDVARSRAQVPGTGSVGRLVLAGAYVACGLVAAATTVASPSPTLSFVLHTVWAVALISIVAAALIRRRDLGVSLGVAVLAAPLLVHYGAVFLGHVVLSEDELGNGTLIDHAREIGLAAVALAALATPYCLAPRPVARALSKLTPIAVALLVGGLGAVLLRRDYASAMELAANGAGIRLDPLLPAHNLALYLLGIATLAWTLTACALAESSARRDVGMGLALVVLGGYGFQWPFYFLLGVVGLATMIDAAPHLADDEAPRSVRPRTPPIDDEAWQGWIAQLATALRKEAPDAELRTVTVRGDDAEGVTTVMAGERHGVAWKARFGRLSGALVSIDVVCGREVDEATRATFTLHARAEGLREAHPPPPPAAPAVQLDDPSFAARFRIRGDAAALTALLDAPLRARVAAVLDGWVAWWAGASLRFRVFPAIGAPLDHPIPLTELASRGTGTVERMAMAIELLTSIAARGLSETGPGEPALLD